MLSRLDPLIKIVARHAENIHAKMDIRRDESTINERNKRENDENAHQNIPWEDTTEVSTEALRNFLQELLGVSPAAAMPGPVSQDKPVSFPPHSAVPTPAHYDPSASRAVKAYQTTGKMVHDANVTGEAVTPRPEIPVSSASVSLSADFKDEELQQIRGYIEDLAALEKSGVTVLSLQRNMTFLESISQAIHLARR